MKTRTELIDEFHEPPAEFATLDRTDLEALDRALAKLLPGEQARAQLRSTNR